MVLANDLVFAALLSILVTVVVWLLEKIPLKFTTDQRPAIAQGIGALAGFAYSFAPVYEFLNRAPLPLDATPGLYIIGGWWAGLAAIGLHQTVKRTGSASSAGVGLLILTLALGGVGVSLASCSSIGPDGPVIVGTNISQKDAKRALIELQDARVLILKSVATIYMTDPQKPEYIEAVRSIDRLDAEFRKYWDLAALAADAWDPVLFLQQYTMALNAKKGMQWEVPK